MRDQPLTPDPELAAVAAALRSLKPTPSRLDRDLVMFQAGQASARPSRWVVWAPRSIAAGLALVAMGEGALLARRPEPQIIERVVEAPAPPAPPAPIEPRPEPFVEHATPDPDLALGRTDHERLTLQVLRYGLDGLPATNRSGWTTSESPAGSQAEMLRDELRQILDPGDPS